VTTLSRALRTTYARSVASNGGARKSKALVFNDLHVKTRVDDTSHDDHIYRLSRPRGLSQDICPRTIGQLCVREDQWGRILPTQNSTGLLARFGMDNAHALVFQGPL
jgi:hypothetical protein